MGLKGPAAPVDGAGSSEKQYRPSTDVRDSAYDTDRRFWAVVRMPGDGNKVMHSSPFLSQSNPFQRVAMRLRKSASKSVIIVAMPMTPNVSSTMGSTSFAR